MALWLFMLDIKNKLNLAINNFIEDLIYSSPDLKDKLNNISPIHFSFQISNTNPVFIEINNNNVGVSLDKKNISDFLISITPSEIAKYFINKSIDKKYIEGDEEKAFVLLNTLKKTNIDFAILAERNFGHIPGVMSYLASFKIDNASDVTIEPDALSKKLRSISIRLDRLEASNNET